MVLTIAICFCFFYSPPCLGRWLFGRISEGCPDTTLADVG